MPDFENSIVTSIDTLRALYAQPIERSAKKQLDHVNEAGRAFIAASPFLVLATGARQGLDCLRAISRASLKLRKTVGRCSYQTVAVTIGLMASRTLLKTRVSD
jgi:hypothetical protein